MGALHLSHMPIVYQATNRANGLRYIGVSKKTLNSRRTQHFCHARRTPEKMPFLAAIAEYGEAAFAWEILETYDSYQDAVDAEIRLIADLKPEYNVTKGGPGITGVRRSPSWVAQWMERRHRGPEASSRKVICLDDGKIYPSASEAARTYGVPKSAVIEMCLGRRYRRSIGGKRFEYVERTAAEVAASAVRESAQRRTKLTEADVREIKGLLQLKSDQELGALFGVHKATINDIRRGKSWRKVAVNVCS